MNFLETYRRLNEDKRKPHVPAIPPDKNSSLFAQLYTTDMKMYSGSCRVWQSNVGSILHNVEKLCAEVDKNFILMNSILSDMVHIKKCVEPAAQGKARLDSRLVGALLQCFEAITIPTNDSCIKVSRMATLMNECGQNVQKSMMRLQTEAKRRTTISQLKMSRSKFTSIRMGCKPNLTNRHYHGQLRGRKSQRPLRRTSISVLAKKTSSQRLNSMLRSKSDSLVNNEKRTDRAKRQARGNSDDVQSDSASNCASQGKASLHAETQAKGETQESNKEPIYCICRQVSYGNMIGCDNEQCVNEWFHFKCVNLVTKPKGKWYCPDCRDGRANRCKLAVKN